MRLKIFSCHHLLPDYEVSAPLFQTLVSGVTLPEGSRAISDLAGRNISTKQKFSELRHQYYVWRNLLGSYDHVGFEHYRRPFYIDPLPLEDLEQKYPELVSVRQDFARNRRGAKLEVNPDQLRMFNEMREGLTDAEHTRLADWITSHEILITEPIFENIEANFLLFHADAQDLWKEFILRASSSRHFKTVQQYFSLPINWSGYRNMYIMQSELFDEYMEIVFSLLLELDAAYPAAPDRIWGHMSERLLGAFIVKKSIEMPLLRCRAIPHLQVPSWYLSESDRQPAAFTKVNPWPKTAPAGTMARSEQRMPRIACLMMLKDEHLLAELWLRYHGYLFGFENLYVYDNGSRDERVLATLRRFAAAGVNVDFSRSSTEDFVAKGNIIGGKIQEFKDADRYDIAIPLDCDEFVALAGNCGPSLSRAEINAELKRIHEAGATCQTEKCLYNVPGYLDQFWLSGFQKCIVPVPAFRDLDHGFHLANFHFESYVAGELYGATRFCYIHLHHKPFEHLMDGVTNKIGGSVDIKNSDAVKAYTGFGHHLTKYPGMTQETYYTHIESGGTPFLRFTGFLRLCELLMDFSATRQAWESGRPASHGHEAMLDLDETPFAAADYLAANTDLADEANLFFHYVETGYGEGRALGTASALREAALSAMQQGRNAEAVGLWAEFRARFPADPEGYDCAVIACRNAGIDADEIILAALGTQPEYLGIAAAIAQSAGPPRAEVFREAIGRLALTNPGAC